MIKSKINYTLIIVIGIIVNSDYIGTSLSGLIQDVKSKGKNLLSFLKEVLY